MLDGVDPVLEGSTCGTHVRDHRANITDNCGENQHPAHQVDRYENVLYVLLWARHLADGRQNEGGPVEGVDIATGERISYSAARGHNHYWNIRNKR